MTNFPGKTVYKTVSCSVKNEHQDLSHKKLETLRTKKQYTELDKYMVLELFPAIATTLF